MKRRKRTPRGPDGSIRGLTAHVAEEMLVRVVWALQREGRSFFMADAAALLVEMGVQEPGVLEGFKFALMGMPGIRKGRRRGEFILPPNAIAHARHRAWRISMGRANLADALVVARALGAVPERDLTPNLERLLARLLTATGPLLKEDA